MRLFVAVRPSDEVLDQLDALPRPEVPGVRWSPLGSRVVVVPVAGLDAMATTVVDATRHIGKPPPARTFAGHITLARLKHPTVRCPMVGSSVAARWAATEVELIRSHVSNAGSRYETLAVIPTDQRNATPDSPSR